MSFQTPRRRALRALLAICIAALARPTFAATEPDAVRVRLETNRGNIELELDRKRAPLTVANFLGYIESGHFNGTIFHRVIAGFMIQGGGYDADFERRSTRSPIQNEGENGLKNKRGTIAMARTAAPHSATAQFFINLADNAFLDHPAPPRRGWGYAVFGRVTAGMDVVDAIGTTKTGPRGPFPKDSPVETITIERAVKLD